MYNDKKNLDKSSRILLPTTMSFKATNDTWDVLYEVAGQVVRLKMKDLVFLKFDFQNSGVLGGFPPPVAAKNAFFPNQGVSQVSYLQK